MKLNKLLIIIIVLSSCDNIKNNSYEINYKIGEEKTIILKNDSNNGDRIYISPSGDFMGFEKFLNGKKHGASLFFYKSGNTESNWNYYEGHPDGHCYNYGDSYEGYPMEFLIYSGSGKLIYREKRDSTGKVISKEGGVPKEWLKPK
jgi:hypothetical protein